MANLNPKWIIGKTVARVEMNPYNGGTDRHPVTNHAPVIWFTDGSHIDFSTEETDDGSSYGTAICYWKPRKPKP